MSIEYADIFLSESSRVVAAAPRNRLWRFRAALRAAGRSAASAAEPPPTAAEKILTLLSKFKVNLD